MTTLRKRVLSLVLVLCMTLSLLFALQLSVVAADEDETVHTMDQETSEDVDAVEENEEEVEDVEDGEEPATIEDIYPISAPTDEVSFTDIEGHWGAPYIMDAAAKDLVKGMGDGTYAPEGKVTRAQFVQMMMNLLGETEAGAECIYSDVAEDAWYYAPVTKAAELGLIVFAGNEFLPEQPITREEMATLLSKSLQLKGISADIMVKLDEELNDALLIDDVYFDDVCFVYYYDIMLGMDDSSFAPQGETTRAQAATVLTKAWTALNGDDKVEETDDVDETEEDGTEEVEDTEGTEETTDETETEETEDVK